MDTNTNSWKRNGLISVFILLFLIVAGCVDYKGEKPASTPSDVEIVKEIALVEKELSAQPAGSEVVKPEATAEVNAEPKKEETVVEKSVVVPGPTAVPNNGTVDVAPSVAAVAADELQVVSVKENEKVRLSVQVNDPDNDTVNHTFSKPLNERGEWKTNYGDAGEYVVTLTATDGKLTVSQKVKLVVERVNVAPVIETVRDLIVNEGETVKFEPVVEDPNKDPVTVTVSEPLSNGVFKTDYTSSGDYKVKVVVSDGELSTEKTFTLTVRDVNVPPELKGVEDLTVKEGQLVSIKPVVSDLDNDPLKVTISSPVGDDGVWQTTYTDHGEYSVTVSVDDGKTKVSKKVTVMVSDVNMPPEIVKVSLNKN